VTGFNSILLLTLGLAMIVGGLALYRLGHIKSRDFVD